MKIIIDTDPGQDDAIALLLALASPEELEVLAITAVAGNVPLELTAGNALKICELAGRPEIPVCAGSDRPLARRLVTAEYVHGTTGIDGATLPEPSQPLDPRPGVEVLVGAPLHDPCVIAYLLSPDLFAGKACNVEIETSSDLTRGMTVVDWWGLTDRRHNAVFMRDVDAAAYFDLIVERLARL